MVLIFIIGIMYTKLYYYSESCTLVLFICYYTLTYEVLLIGIHSFCCCIFIDLSTFVKSFGLLLCLWHKTQVFFSYLAPDISLPLT